MLVLGFGIWGVAEVGGRPVPLAFLGVGLALTLVVAYDYPRRSVVGPEGIDRVCLLRVEHLPWPQVVALERDRGSWVRRGWRPATPSDRQPERPPSGGLVARGGGRRRWLLIDRVESRDEFDRIKAIVTRHADAVVLRARPPAPTVAPTHWYHRTRSSTDRGSDPSQAP